ncbi:tetratricopeptide repeat protein [Candidatus Fermentibacterales bacterium]|nr:tetratricopeptide repeat protein [Candidatus Fermentibacterales bacterium]
MPEEHESLLEHMPLEEVRLERIDGYEPPDGWDPGELEDSGPQPPPVLVERSDDQKYSLLVHHRTVWSARGQGKMALRALVVRSRVHIPVAHGTVRNCLEEALLFEGLLSEGLVDNRSRLADMLGYSRARITQVLNLLKLPDPMKKRLLLEDGVSEFQLRPLVRITDPGARQEAFERLMADNLTGRQMERFLSDRKAPVSSREGRDGAQRRSAGERQPARQAARQTEAGARSRLLMDIQDLMDEEGLPEGGEEVPEREASAGYGAGEGSLAEAGEKQGQREPSGEAFDRLRAMITTLGRSLRDGSWEEDETVLRDLNERDLLFLKGVALMQRGRYENAVEALQEVTDAAPEHSLAYHYLGRCCNLLGRLDSAEGFLRTAIDLRPSDPDVVADLAIVLEKQKRYDEATSCYRVARRMRKAKAAGRS